MPPLEIHQQPEGRATIQLDPYQGEALRSLIIQSSGMTFNRYLEKVGLQPTNVANYLSGRNRMSFTTLYKLLAGTSLSIQCLLQVTITNGSVVESADYTPLEEMLYLPEQDTYQEESTLTPPSDPIPAPLPCLQNIPTSCFSEKLQDSKKTTQDSPSRDLVGDFFTQCSILQQSLLTTLSQIPSHVDQQPSTSEETPSTENPPLQR